MILDMLISRPLQRDQQGAVVCVFRGAVRLVVMVEVMTRKKQIEGHDLWTLEQPSGSLL